MKCKYLLRLNPVLFVKDGWTGESDISLMSKIVMESALSKATDIVLCKADISECPKKKQPCEINRRCWELG